MINSNDLLPLVNSPSDLISALGEVEREDRRDLKVAVLALTRHEDPLVREQALSVLLLKWRDTALRPVAVKLLKSDDDFGVRAQAALGIAAVSTAETHAADVRLLLDTILDVDEDENTRRSAYDALLLLYRRTDFPSRGMRLDIERDLDWEWIQELKRSV